MTATYQHPDLLVSTQWLEDHLHDPALRLFECTTWLDYLPSGCDAPYRVVSGYANYFESHIENAAFVDIQAQLSDSNSPPHLRFTRLPADELATAFAALGIGDDSRVVLYSRGRQVWATRVWWLLRSVGFDQATILDGGWEQWRDEQRPTTNRKTVYPASVLTAHPSAELFSDKAAMVAAMNDPQTCVVNALDGELHRGENARYGRPGRIPGSANVPASDLVQPGSNLLQSAQTAMDMFERAGAHPERPVAVYCGGGIAATLDAFVLHQLGYTRISVYDASMSEWARDDSLPIETD